MASPRTPTSATALAALGSAVHRMTAVASLARAIVDHVPDKVDGGKADCLDALEMFMLRPAALELQSAYEKAQDAVR